MKKIFAFLLIVFLCAGTAMAADVNEEWEKLVKALDNDDKISDETKEALKSFSKALIENKRGEELAPGELSDRINEWFDGKKRLDAADRLFGTKTKRGLLERLTIYGDFRYRFQVDHRRDSISPSAWAEDDGAEYRHSHKDRAQQMVRLRIGFELNIEEDLLDFGARLTTGDACDPHGEDAVFDDDFAKIDVNFDRIYLRYTPFTEDRPYRLLGVANLSTEFYLGKFDHEWLFLISYPKWDCIVQPTGMGVLARLTEIECDFIDELRVSLAFYQATEENYNEDATIFVAQIGYIKDFQIGDHEFTFTAAAAIYDVNDPTDDNGTSSIIAHGTYGDNGLTANDTQFISEFNIMEYILQLDWSGFELLGKTRPVSLQVAFTHNTSANGDPDYPRHSSEDVDDGMSITLTIGELEGKGDWQFGYYYGNYERDSLFSLFSGPEIGDGTNCIESAFWLEYMIFDKTSLMLWYAMGQDRIDDGPYTASEDDHMQGVFRVEINIEF